MGTTPSAFVASSKKVEFADETSANYSSALETDQPPFDPVENDDYGSGQKEGCTQEMLFTGGASSYLPVLLWLQYLLVCSKILLYLQTCPTMIAISKFAIIYLI